MKDVALKNFQSDLSRFGNLKSELPRLFLDGNGVIWSYEGEELSYGFAFRITTGADISLSGPDRRNQLTESLRAFIRSVEEDAFVQVLYDRRAVQESELEKASGIKNLAHDSRLAQKQSEYLKNEAMSERILKEEAYISLRYVIGEEIYRRFSLTKQVDRERLSAALDQLRMRKEAVASVLQTVGLEVADVSRDAGRSLLADTFNPGSEIPRCESSDGQNNFDYAFSDISYDKEAIEINGVYHKVISFLDPPESTHSNQIFEIMRKFSGPLRLVVSFRIPRQDKEIGKLVKRRNVSFAFLSEGGGGAENLQHERINRASGEVLNQLMDGERVCSFSWVAVLSSPNLFDLKLKVKRIQALWAQQFGVIGFAERLAIFEVFRRSTPLFPRLHDSPRLITGSVLADLLPVYCQPESDVQPVSVFTNARDTMVSLDLMDPRVPPYNYLVTGKSGSGKSVLIQSKLADVLLKRDNDLSNSKVLILDIGGPFGSSYKKFVKLFGGKTYDVSIDGNFSLNLFDLPKGELSPSPGKLALNLKQLEVICGDDREPFSSLEREKIYQSLSECYEQFQGGGFRLTNYREYLLERNDSFYETLAQRLYSATHNSSVDILFNRETKVDFDASVICFDTRNLLKDERIFRIWVLAYADYVERLFFENKTGLKVLVWDEFWQLADKLKDLTEFICRCGRRSRPLVFFVSQSILDFTGSALASTFSNTVTKMFFLNQSGNLSDVERLMGLPPEVVAAIESLKSIKGRYSDVLYAADGAYQKLRLRLSSYEYGAYTSDFADLSKLEGANADSLQQSIESTFEKGAIC